MRYAWWLGIERQGIGKSRSSKVRGGKASLRKSTRPREFERSVSLPRENIYLGRYIYICIEVQKVFRGAKGEVRAEAPCIFKTPLSRCIWKANGRLGNRFWRSQCMALA